MQKNDNNYITSKTILIILDASRRMYIDKGINNFFFTTFFFTLLGLYYF